MWLSDLWQCSTTQHTPNVDIRSYYTGLTPRLLPSRCGYTRSTYNPTRPGFLLGLRRDWEFRDFFVDGINSACRALNVSIQLASIRDLYPTYTWRDLAAHRGIVPLPCQPSATTVTEQYRMNIPLFLPSTVLKHFTVYEFNCCFLADRTATQYDRLLAAAFCPSVCPSVMLCIVALRVGVRR